MMEIDNDLERSVKEFLSQGLSGIKPAIDIKRFCAEPRVRRQKLLSRWQRPVAVVFALACTVFFLVKIPVASRAFASVPLLGDAYVSFLKQANLDAAYQAGLLTRLDKTLTKNGLTLTVIDAGVDGNKIVVSYSVSPAGGENPDGIWARLARGEIMLSARVEGRGSTNFVQAPDPETNKIYGVVHVDKPKGPWFLWGSKITLLVDACKKEPYFDHPFDQVAWKAGRVLYSWTMSVPVRAVEVEPTIVPINKELVAGKDIITLEHLAFTPWRTVLKYTVRNAQPSDTPDRSYWRLLGDCLSLITRDGKSVYVTGGPVPEGWGAEAVGHGEVHFQSVPNQDLTVVFKKPRFEPGTLRLPLEQGATVSCLGGQGSLTVAAIDKLEGGVKVTTRLESDLRLRDAWVRLVDSQGELVRMAPFVSYGRDNDVQFSFVTDLDSGPYHLEITRLFALEREGTTVFEVRAAGD